MRIRSITPEFWRSADIDPMDSQAFKEFGTAPPGREFLYRLHSETGELLYVGITWNPFVRWRVHKREKPWWGEVARADVYLCLDDRDARDWETWCIKALDPKYNKHQKRGWKP